MDNQTAPCKANPVTVTRFDKFVKFSFSLVIRNANSFNFVMLICTCLYSIPHSVTSQRKHLTKPIIPQDYATERYLFHKHPLVCRCMCVCGHYWEPRCTTIVEMISKSFKS